MVGDRYNMLKITEVFSKLKYQGFKDETKFQYMTFQVHAEFFDQFLWFKPGKARSWSPAILISEKLETVIVA